MSAAPPAAGEVGGRRAARDVAAQLTLRGLNLALGVAVTVLLVRGLGDAAFGQWSTVFAVTAILTYFGDLGLEQAAVRQAAADPERRNEWVGALVGLRFVLSIPAALLGGAALMLLADGVPMRVTGLLAAGGLLLGGLGALRVLFQLEVRNDVPASFELANGLLWSLAVVLLYLAGAGMIAYATAFVGTAAMVTVALAVYAVRRFGISLRGTRGRWGHLLRVGFPVGISTLLILAYGRMNQVLVFELAGDRAAGLFGAAYRILERAQLLPSTVMATLFPVLAAARVNDMERMRRVFRLGGELLLLCSLPFVAFASVAGEPLVRLLFGDDFAPAGTALAILMGAFALISVGFLAGFTVIVLDLQKRFVRYALVGLVFNLSANAVLIPRYGFVAAAWITLATEVVVLTPTFRAIFSEMDFTLPVGRLLRIVGAAAGLAALLAVAAAAGLPLGGLVAVALVAYPALVLALRAVDLRELKQLLS